MVFKEFSSQRILHLFTYEHYNTIRTHIFFQNLTTGTFDHRIHFLSHLMVAHEPKRASRDPVQQTCTHVFKSPSAIAPIIYVYFNTFSHRKSNPYFRVLLAIFFFPFFLDNRFASASLCPESSMSCCWELRCSPRGVGFS